MLSHAAEEMKKSGYSKYMCNYLTGEFYIDGWDDSFGYI
jgi:hypothetical protein